MKEHAAYLWYVMRHRWYVFLECCKLGIPWLGMIHDLSRFHPSEWFPYAASQPYKKTTPPFEKTPTFDMAWNDHQHRNKHHWEYWVHFDYQNHEMRLLPMPDAYRREMLADWRGASRSKGGNDVGEWYKYNGKQMMLHQETRIWLEKQLGINSHPPR